jgi:hypothetical protein
MAPWQRSRAWCLAKANDPFKRAAFPVGPVRFYTDPEHYFNVPLLIAEFALWVVLTVMIVLLAGLIRPRTNRARSGDSARAALRENCCERDNGEAINCASGLLRLRVAVAGQVCYEADVRDADELRMNLGWVKSISPNTLTTVEVSRSGKSIVFANRLEPEAPDSLCWRAALKPGVERIGLDSLGETLEQPLIDMMLREWL